MRVLLTGSTGRLGGAFLLSWGSPDSIHRTRVIGRGEMDLSQPGQVRSALTECWHDEPFDVLVNPAAVSGLEQCLDQSDLARAVNVEAPRQMAEFCAQHGVKLVHFSTDYVFDGESDAWLGETAAASPVNVYGETKRQGELRVLGCCPEAIVARVSWLFGPGCPTRTSHFDQVLARAMAGEKQSLIDDKFSMPTYTMDIVDWIDQLLQRNAKGLYHLCNSGRAESWFSYAEEIIRLAAGQGYQLRASHLNPMSITDADFFREIRPVYTAMRSTRLSALGIHPRPWLDAAEEYLKIR